MAETAQVPILYVDGTRLSREIESDVARSERPYERVEVGTKRALEIGIRPPFVTHGRIIIATSDIRRYCGVKREQ